MKNVIVNEHEDVTNIEDYISMTKMECNGTWGTEVEIATLSHLLDTSIYSYTHEPQERWLRVGPSFVHGTFADADDDLNEMGIYMYIHNPRDRFEVVTSISYIVITLTIKIYPLYH